METYKKVVVATVSTRKFVEALLYMGSIGGEIDDSCTAFKGAMLRTEVILPEATPVTESQVIKVSVQPLQEKPAKEKIEVENPKPAKKQARKKEAGEDTPAE